MSHQTPDVEFDEAAWGTAKERSLSQLLIKLARRLDEEAIQRLRLQYGVDELTRAHTKLLPHIDIEGTRITELADRLEVSKQAASQRVRELEDMGALERVPDPSDGRAKLVKFADPQSLFLGLEVLDEVGDEAFGWASDEQLTTVIHVIKRALKRLDSD